jgi:uncharacterized protein (UPF0261 family)
MPTVLLIGTLDTKGPETAYLRDQIRALGCDTLVLDSGILGEAIGIEADLNRRVVAQAAGSTLEALQNAGTRGKAVEEMLKGVRKLTLELFAEGRIHGVASLGGAEGAVLAASAMKGLPVGFPKLIVSPLASGHRKFAPFVGTKDIMIMHSVVDILGLNPVSRAVFDSVAGAIAGMAQMYASHPSQPSATQPRRAMAATMLGNTTRPLMRLKPYIEAHDVDFVIFHANGVGGPAMEELIQQNYFSCVLDYTLNEIAGYIAGGFHNGGPARLDAAGALGIPQVIVPGCLDFAVFGAKHEVPADYHGRPTYYHNPEFTLVRLTHEEQLQAVRFMVQKLNQAQGPVKVVVPLAGGSVMENRDGGSFWSARVIDDTVKILQTELSPTIPVRLVDAHINSDSFADAVLEETLPFLKK